jgi:hypothetical protein
MNSIDSPVDGQNTHVTEPYRAPPKQNIDSLFNSLLSKHIDDDLLRKQNFMYKLSKHLENYC